MCTCVMTMTVSVSIFQVYLYEGTIHLIPYPLTPAHIALLPTGTPTLAEAVTCIRDNPSLTMAEAKVQQEIQARLQGYVYIMCEKCVCVCEKKRHWLR